MKDLSLLIIKPEAIKNKKQIINEVLKRGYTILSEKKFGNYPFYAKKLYKVLSKNQMREYLKGYKLHNLGHRFCVLVLIHKKGNTIKRLRADKGDWKSYSNEIGTMRKMFGLPKNYDLFCDGTKLVYCGLHSPNGNEELKFQLKLFKIDISKIHPTETFSSNEKERKN